MQNQAAVEALYSATFVEDYLDFVENVPDDLQRIHTRLRELDMRQHQDVLTELDTLVAQFEGEVGDPVAQKRLLNRMMLPLITSQDLGDDKIQLVQTMSDMIENKTRQLDHDSQNLDFGRGEEEEEGGGGGVRGGGGGVTKASRVKEEKAEKGSAGGGGGGGKRRKIKEEDRNNDENGGGSTPANNKSGGGGNTSTPGGGGGKKMKKSGAAAGAGAGVVKKKGGAGGGGGGGGASMKKEERSASPPELANLDIDPDEPTYCLCDRVSYGEMIGCDNDLCPIEWFHFNCVQLTGKPKGKWFCPKCRGDKPTVMKPKAQFLKELERFNKEKEDKLK